MPELYDPNIPAWRGNLNTEQKKMVRNHLSNLDKVNGGIFTKPKRNITVGDVIANTPDRVVLFIGCGGTGLDALYALKLRLKNELTENDYNEKVRFLAIDSYKSAQFVPGEDPYDINAKKRFETNEFLWLDNASAKDLLNSEAAEEWANPVLKPLILAYHTEHDRYSGPFPRQYGRLLMYVHAQQLNDSVQTLVGQLTSGKNAQLDIYIITGVSGTTGSGIIVDASYIVRAAALNAFPYPERTRISGMLHLPPTGTGNNPSVITKGNQNGYATLKEIDHFMTIDRRGERYCQVFSTGYSVKSESPIFDVCYLFDGNMTRAKLLDPGARATEAMCDSILELITARTVKYRCAYSPIDDMPSDTERYARRFVEDSDPAIAPREANYVYSTLGCGKAIVPVDLIKAYVANGIYAFMYNNVYRNYRVDSSDVDDFIYEALIDNKEFNPQTQKIAIDEVIQRRFCAFQPKVKGGPFFVVELIGNVARELELQRNEIANRPFVFRKSEKMDQLSYSIQYLNDCNARIFSVIAEALEQMKLQLNNESERLFLPNTDINSNEFYPMDFTTLDERSSAVLKFLDNFISPNEKAALAKSFAREMWNKRFQWSRIAERSSDSGTFNGTREFNNFWETVIGARVDAEMENLLIKYYSGNPELKYYTITAFGGGVFVPPECERALDEAARSIYNEMLRNSGRCAPRLAMDLNLFRNYEGKANSLTYFLVPEKCENLKRHLIEIQPNRVLESSSADTVSCLTLISGLPAFMAAWTRTAEPQYEQAIEIGTQCLHMTETKYGDNWVNFPNLLTPGIWLTLDDYSNTREKAIYDDVRNIFFRAVSLGIARQNIYCGTVFSYYTISVLNDRYLPELKYIRDVEREHDGTAQYTEAKRALDDRCHELAEELLKDAGLAASSGEAGQADSTELSGLYRKFTEEHSLNFPQYVTTKPLNYGEVPEPAWAEGIAVSMLRMHTGYFNKLRGTVMVLERLQSIIKDKRV